MGTTLLFSKLVNKEKDSSIYPAFLIQTVPYDNQIVDEGKFLSRVELIKYYSFVTLMKSWI